MSSFSERLKKLRKHLKLSQKQIAEELSITQSFYARLENALSEVKIEYIQILFDKFQVSPTWLIAGKKPMLLPDTGDYAQEVANRIKSERKKNHHLAVNFSVSLSTDIDEIENAEYLPDPLTIVQIAFLLSKENPYHMLVYLLTGERFSSHALSINPEDFDVLMDKYESIKRDLNLSDKRGHEILRSIINAKLSGSD